MANFLSKNLTYLREFNRYNQRDFASLFETTQATLSNYEKGRTEPTLLFLEMVCSHFNISMDDLIRNDLSISKNHYVQTAKEVSKIQDTMVSNLYEKMLDVKDETISSKDKVISTKDDIIVEKDKRIELLEKHNGILETLVNQQKIMDSIDIIRKIDEEMDKNKS